MCRLRSVIPDQESLRIFSRTFSNVPSGGRLDYAHTWWTGTGPRDRAASRRIAWRVIAAENRSDGPGAMFTVKLPLPSGELMVTRRSNASAVSKRRK